VRPSIVKRGSPVQIEFYPSNQLKKFHADIHHPKMMRNNETINFSNESHEVIEASEIRHVLKIKSVTTEDAGDYRVDCGGVLGTTNTACLNITGLRYFSIV